MPPRRSRPPVKDYSLANLPIPDVLALLRGQVNVCGLLSTEADLQAAFGRNAQTLLSLFPGRRPFFEERYNYGQTATRPT